MYKPYPSLALLVLLLAACSAPAPEPTATTEAPPTTNSNRCYLGVVSSDNGRISDSLSLTLRTKDDTVVGRLNWRPQEKDRLQGRILGAVTGDSIHAVLTYRAEGEEAKEERSFVIEKGNLVELEGARHLVKDTWMYETRAKLERGMVLQEVDCEANRRR